MSNRHDRRRYRKAQDRHVWVFSELNHNLQPEQMARILTSAGLEQARREAEALAQDRDRDAPAGEQSSTSQEASDV